jgi:hypothetical protein
MEVQFRTQYGSRWSNWYILGIWASDDSAIKRHSVQSQRDSDGAVAADTFVSSNKEETTKSFQLKVRLFSGDESAVPSVRGASVAYSTAPPRKAGMSVGNPALWNTLLRVPPYSQMIYPKGGNVWCSPTSTAMVLSYLDHYVGDCESRVRRAATKDM